jgi:hypothetical protein
MDYSLSERVLSELIDTLCHTKSVSVPVIHDIFSATQYQILEELRESYTDNEIKKVVDTINGYGFMEFIRTLADARIFEYERERID